MVQRLADIQQIEATLNENGYQLDGELGRGGFAIVYKVLSNKYHGSAFAAKVISFSNNSTTRFNILDQYINEVSTLKRILHSNVISIYDHFRDKNSIYIIFEYCANGNLKELISRRGPLKKEKFVQYARFLLEGLNACHESGVAHHDVKPENILINDYERPVLSDFGLGEYSMIEDELSTFHAGTEPYLAPEILSNHPFDPKRADIWAMGITFYYMVVGELPWISSNKAELYDAIINGNILFPPLIDRNIVTLIKSMCAKNPIERPSAKELLELPIFQEPKKFIKISGSASSLASVRLEGTSKLPNSIRFSKIKSQRVPLPQTFITFAMMD